MPIIPFLAVSGGKLIASFGICSQEAYDHYMKDEIAHKPFEYSVAKNWLIEYLKTKSIEVDLIDTNTFLGGIAENGHLMLSAQAPHIDIFDVKSICEKFALNYDTLIDTYSAHLKNL